MIPYKFIIWQSIQMNTQMKIQSEAWEGPEHRSFYPCGFGVCPSQHVDVLTNLEKFSKPQSLGIFMEASSWRQGRGEGDMKLKLPSFWSWPGRSYDQPPSRSPPKVASLEQKILLSPGIARDLGALCQTFLSLTKLQRSWGFYMRNWGERPNIRTKDS